MAENKDVTGISYTAWRLHPVIEIKEFTSPSLIPMKLSGK